jgi:hypothetical protein
MTPNPTEEGINERMKRLLAKPFCPKCHLFSQEHDDNACDMRYVKESANGA